MARYQLLVGTYYPPFFELLRATFQQIRRILKPGGWLYLVDFLRFKPLKSVIFFAYMNRQHQPHIFSLDYERSLRAAFLPEEFQQLAREELPEDVRVFTPFRLPILTLVKNPDTPLQNPELRARFQAMRRALPRRYRQQLDDLRLFFWQGGLKNDPFA